jgi:hypothetical protein
MIPEANHRLLRPYLRIRGFQAQEHHIDICNLVHQSQT